MDVDVAHLRHVLKQSWFVVAAMVLMTTQPFVTVLSKNEDGEYDYAPITTTFLAEVFKLVISIVMYSRLPPTEKSHNVLRLREALHFSVPAFVYFVNNNLIFVILMYVNSTTYQILSSLKTVATGILFRAILKRMLASVQKAAIVLLACGAAVSQFPICVVPTCPAVLDLEHLLAAANQSSDNLTLDEVLQTAAAAVAQTNAEAANAIDAWAPNGTTASGIFVGVAFALFACLNSAFAGVYSELLLKKDGALHSIHLQNMLLYIWGVIFNAIALFVKNGDFVVTNGLCAGYSPAVWLLVTNNALNGLAISAILKFADNIVRVFAHTAAMLLTMVLELLFMGAPFSPQLLVSITIVMVSTFLYNSKPPPPHTVQAASQKLALPKAEEDDERVPARLDAPWAQDMHENGHDGETPSDKRGRTRAVDDPEL